MYTSRVCVYICRYTCAREWVRPWTVCLHILCWQPLIVPTGTLTYSNVQYSLMCAVLVSRFFVHEGPLRARRNYLRSQGMLLIFWDLITIPLVLEDATEDTQNFLVLVSHCTVWYWIVDLFYNFFTGYDTGAGIEMILGRHGREQNAGLGEMFGTPLTWVTSRWGIHPTKSVCPCQTLQGLQGESLWDAVCKLDFGWLWMDHKAWAKFRFRGEDSNPIHEKWGVLRKLPATISEHGCCLTQL